MIVLAILTSVSNTAENVSFYNVLLDTKLTRDPRLLRQHS
jgi:hypothetical protein